MSRFLLIGLDGAEPTLCERWMNEGRLPALASLRDRGAYLPCASVEPPVTFPAWCTCVTGMNPGRHGIFDFTEQVDGEYAIRFVNSTHRRAPALWNILSQAGKRVCVLGVPGTYPPEAVNGIMVAGFDSPVATRIDRSFVEPPEIYDEVIAWRFADFQEHDIGEGWHTMAHAKLLAKIDDKAEIAERLLRREPWDFFMVVFGESDTVSHHFWSFHDPQSPRFRPGKESAIREVYEKLDHAVARLIDAAGEEVVVGVCSDHGFGGAGTGVVHINNWLAENGYLTFAPARGSMLKRAALRFTPHAARGALFRAFEGLAARAESHSRYAGIDFAHTRAWSDELNYFPSIRVNLAGREQRGVVVPGEYDAFCAELCERLESWDVIACARRRSDVYDGPFVERAPDIIIELALENSYSHSCIRSRGGPSFRRLQPDEYPGGKERGMTGNHRPTGVLFLSRPTPCGAARLEDLAPTVLAELGVAGPPMDGTSLLSQYSESEAASGYALASASVYSQAQERAIEQRLRDLGYFE
ncbi:MAG: alkaline phosphatase family protein [Candidatus Hydrogenedentes bacterium]|nr:alkaline phosphatase family protein [Candidatus Hydrogenedentota bacterium]